jgi:protein-L-isoaspartate(D-aspartate) O-methyltransferase
MTIHAPIPDYDTARRTMVESQLRPQGVTDPGVLEAMGSVPREKFVPEAVRPIAYADRAVMLGHGRALSPCPVLGQLLTQMAPSAGERALVVGAGTGYSVAILQRIGLDVTALESCEELGAAGRDLGLKIILGDLEEGHSAGAPYDLILIDGAVEYIPQPIIDQLAPGGRLGAALVEQGVTRLVVGRKSGSAFGYIAVNDSSAPALPGFKRHRTFTF